MVVPPYLNLKMVSHGTYFLYYILYSQSLPNIYRRVSGFFLDLHGNRGWVESRWSMGLFKTSKAESLDFKPGRPNTIA